MLDAWLGTRRGCVAVVGQERSNLPQENPPMLELLNPRIFKVGKDLPDQVQPVPDELQQSTEHIQQLLGHLQGWWFPQG